MKKTLVSLSMGLALFAATALPGLASAATLSTNQIQSVISLLQAFGVDSSTIANVQTTLSGVTTTPPSTASTTALTVQAIGLLHLGSQGDGVKYLQTLLAADPSIYPSGNISGYFGAQTQAALKNYQRKHGLAPTGSVSSSTLKDLDDDLANNPIGTENGGNATSSVRVGNKHLCAIVPPGHLIAPGWLKKHGGVAPVIPPCQVLPPGIGDRGEHGTTTPPVVDVTAPVLSGIAAINLTSTGANIQWTTNENSTSQVEYGTTSAYGNTSTLNTSLVTAHSVVLGGLATSTLYHYRVDSRDSSSNLATSNDLTFTTLADTAAPVISGTAVTNLASTSATISWNTNEIATSKVYFGTTSPLNLGTATNVSSGTLMSVHSINLTGLATSTTYFYVVASADASSNTATTSQASFTTLAI